LDYQKTLDYLYTQLPMFQRTGAAAYKGSLDNTIALCDLLDNPQEKFKSIHIAGTNGKGSVSHLLASILQEKGFKTGLYTSPHLRDFRERIKINGKNIPKEKVTEFVKRHRKNFEVIKPSFFEMTVALAFDHFANEKIDIAVIETGLGGRLDSTNVIHPLLSIITNISNDHASLLGDTLQKIAAEKAGIIKRNIPVVIGETQNEVKEVFIEKALQVNSPIVFADKEYGFDFLSYNDEKHLVHFNIQNKGGIALKDLSVPLPGKYQERNLVTVISSVNQLNIYYHLGIETSVIARGIENVISNTGLLGRWQRLSVKPKIICDTAHNEAGVGFVLKQIEQTSHKNLHIVWGMVNDKEISKILSMLPENAIYYFCKPDIPRGLDAHELQKQASAFKLNGNVYPSVSDALKDAKTNASNDDLIFVGGSTFVVAEVV
jgi:dihydrofolate synthase / folylpolyglutamate synthase